MKSFLYCTLYLKQPSPWRHQALGDTLPVRALTLGSRRELPVRPLSILPMLEKLSGPQQGQGDQARHKGLAALFPHSDITAA